MSVRVVARIRPLLKSELDKDTIVMVDSKDDQNTIVRIPNPKNEGESFSFQFNSVHGQEASQQDLFDNEVGPTIKHLFAGFDVTLFAYGVTGTGKTHTMRGGKQLADRGVIPRMLSAIYRRARKIEKDSAGSSHVDVIMSYYEIYNDKVFDLFEAPEKRGSAGLALRDNGGKTVVVGLTERPCESLKEFEKLYDQANVNRSTSATKLNAHSSRSHAILCVKICVTTGETTRTSTASAIDLAGSEDNRRTDNGKDRMVESASINKSLFVLAQCVEAISKKQARIPYRESKMTRILSLGQNNGLTIMILNLAPVRSYHLETLSSLNFANRTKKIEIREVENEPVFKGCSRPVMHSISGTTIQRQPLRPLASTVHNTVRPFRIDQKGKPAKLFDVYTEKSRNSTSNPLKRSPLKRSSDGLSSSRRTKVLRRSPVQTGAPSGISEAAIEEMVEKKVTSMLAARALEQPARPQAEISEDVKRRLEMLEQKIEGKEDERSRGLTFLLMAKQHHVRGEDSSALKMYELAREHFPENAKLEGKILKLKQKLQAKAVPAPVHTTSLQVPEDDEYHDAPDDDYEDEDGFRCKPKHKKIKVKAFDGPITPRAQQLLAIINTRDVSQIKQLKGVGAKKAEAIVEALGADTHHDLANLAEVARLKGVGVKTVENMRVGLALE